VHPAGVMSLIDRDSAFESPSSPLIRGKKEDNSYNPEDGTTRLSRSSSLDEELQMDDNQRVRFKSSRELFVYCCLGCVLLLAGCGFTTYYLYPRYPDIQIYSEAKINSFQLNQSSFFIDLVVPVFIENPNYITCSFHFPLCDISYGVQIVATVINAEKNFLISSGVSQNIGVEAATSNALKNSSELVNQLNQDCQSLENNVTMNISLKVGCKCILKTLIVSIDSMVVIPCSFNSTVVVPFP